MKEKIRELIKQAIIKLQQSGQWPELQDFDFDVEYPPHREQGDYAVNVAMQLAHILRKNPLAIAQEIKEKIETDQKLFSKVETVNPGFINFFVKPEYLSQQIKTILEEESKYAQNNLGENKKVQVEFISANPTGPLHMGNGRGGFAGDVLSNVLKKSGFKVSREYYLNDRGKQVETLGESVMRRFLQEQGIKVDYPEDLYQGEYIQDLAKKLRLKEFDKNKSQINQVPKIKAKVKNWAYAEMLKNIKETVEKTCQIKMDNWFSEASLYQGDLRDKMWQFLEEEELIYEKDDAWWFKAARFGDDKDRVIIKGDKEATYFFSDILYLKNRLTQRKLDKVIMIWGADHHGDIARVQAAAEVLGFKGKVDILLYQLVRLMFKGKEVRMSKRKGNFVTLDELVEEVGLDAARFFFLMNSLDKSMDFDLNLAKEKSQKNPVYYVQYAHARICNILRKIPNTKSKILKLEYSETPELNLIKELVKYPDLVRTAAENYETHHLPFYALELAHQFHNFYDKCRVIENGKVNPSRFVLIKATRIVLNDVLELMGIQAPKSM